jgi:hypothetical protein
MNLQRGCLHVRRLMAIAIAIAKGLIMLARVPVSQVDHRCYHGARPDNKMVTELCPLFRTTRVKQKKVCQGVECHDLGCLVDRE